MRLAWATDVHLNFLPKRGIAAFGGELSAQRPDAVLITGDLSEAPELEAHLRQLAEALPCPLYFVLGNHDFYRGSLRAVRARMRELPREGRARWLPALGVVPLTHDAALVGVDGWADGRYGAWEASQVLLNDYVFIEELSGLTKARRLEVLRATAQAEAEALRPVLSEALERFPVVYVATHVPPFREACWYEGRISNDDWLPHFTCKAVGEVLLEGARASPGRQLQVLCGHTHGEGSAQPLPNLRVLTGGAEYGHPKLAGFFEID
ncbi:MAG: metallophosphoesterase [Deltaproteobacteria bacterium]|nr:metallophosphoesterase [Deltaproteobacteria bacterium]